MSQPILQRVPLPERIAPAERPGRRLAIHRKAAPYVFVSPFLILFAAFGVWPIIHSLILAFYSTNGPRSQVFVGVSNFKFMFADPDFHRAVWNTLVYTFWSVFLQLPLALGLAILLNQPWLKARSVLRLAFFAPNLLGQVFVSVLFGVLFVPQYGLVNLALHRLLGIPLDTKWLADPNLVMPAIVLTSLWLYVGANMIYFLAALQAVGKELYEAAIVDGANAWQQFLAVTIPSIRPVLIFMLVTATIGSLQLFELPYILLGNTAGPNNSGLTIVMYLYNSGFISGDLGYGSAVGWVLACGILIISLLQLRFTGAWKGKAA